MSCWTEITGMVEISSVFENEEELQEYNINYINHIISDYFSEEKNLLKGSEGILYPSISINPEGGNIILNFRSNLRDFGKRKGESGKADFEDLKKWVLVLIDNLNKLFNYNDYIKKMDSIYEYIDKHPDLVKFLEENKNNKNKELYELYNKKVIKIKKKFIEDKFDKKEIICGTVYNSLFQGHNSFGDTIKINLIDYKFEVLENNKLTLQLDKKED